MVAFDLLTAMDSLGTGAIHYAAYKCHLQAMTDEWNRLASMRFTSTKRHWRKIISRAVLVRKEAFEQAYEYNPWRDAGGEG